MIFELTSANSRGAVLTCGALVGRRRTGHIARVLSRAVAPPKISMFTKLQGCQKVVSMHLVLVAA
jgi:hypothetical protein